VDLRDGRRCFATTAGQLQVVIIVDWRNVRSSHVKVVRPNDFGYKSCSLCVCLDASADLDDATMFVLSRSNEGPLGI
jgi:hypothetical protein